MFTEPAPLWCTLCANKAPGCGAAPRSGIGTDVAPTPAARRDGRTRDRSPFASQPGWRRLQNLEGHVHFLPLGLYLTGLEVLRRLLQVFFSKGIWFCACVIKPEIYLLPSPLLFLFDCQPHFLDRRSTMFPGEVLVYAQGILKPTRFLIFSGFQSFDQGRVLRVSSL